eukprot:3416558-Rhodomonas_salina.1
MEPANTTLTAPAHAETESPPANIHALIPDRDSLSGRKLTASSDSLSCALQETQGSFHGVSCAIAVKGDETGSVEMLGLGPEPCVRTASRSTLASTAPLSPAPTSSVLPLRLACRTVEAVRRVPQAETAADGRTRCLAERERNLTQGSLSRSRPIVERAEQT